MKKLQIELSHYSVMPKQFLDPKSKYFKLTDKQKMTWMRLFDLWKQAHAQGKKSITFGNKKGFATKVLGISRQAFYTIFKKFEELGMVKVTQTDLEYFEIDMFELEDEKLYAEPKKSKRESTAKKTKKESIPKTPTNPFSNRVKKVIRQEVIPNGFENWEMADGNTVGIYEPKDPLDSISPGIEERTKELQMKIRQLLEGKNLCQN